MAFAHARRAALTRNTSYAKQLVLRIFFNEETFSSEEASGNTDELLAVLRPLDRHNLPSHLRGVIPGVTDASGQPRPVLQWVFRQKAAAVMAAAARISTFLTVYPTAPAVGIINGLALGTAGVHALQDYFPSRQIKLMGVSAVSPDRLQAFKYESLQIEDRPEAQGTVEIWFSEPDEAWRESTPAWAPLPEYNGGGVRTQISLPSTSYQAVSDPHEADQYPLSTQQRYALLSAVWAQEQAIGFAHLLDVSETRSELVLGLVLNKEKEDLLSFHQGLKMKDAILSSINQEINQHPETGEFSPRIWLADQLVGFPGLQARPASAADLTKLVTMRGRF